MNPTDYEIALDVCGLDPPEPPEKVLSALNSLERGCRLRMLIDREPLPLYDLLTRRGFQYRVELRPDGRRKICIWRTP